MTAPSEPTTGTTTWIEVPEAPPIPGLRFRRRREGDADPAAAARLLCAAAETDRIPWRPTTAEIREDWDQPTVLDPIDDLLLAEIDGQLVGYGLVERVVRDGVTVFSVDGAVDPAVRRRGIGRALFAHDLRRAEARAVAEPPDAEIAFGGWVQQTEAGAIALLEAAGFTAVRWFQVMRRDLTRPIPEAPLPPGLEIRPVVSEDHRTIFDAEVEAFRDHWGAHDPTPEAFERTYGREEFDGSLWIVAWDGAEVAGVVQNWIWPKENADMGVRRGWLEHISVRRPWRRRGLARAITAASLRRLRDVGMDEAMLGVDADNPNGALGLYQGLGFEESSRGIAYRRPRPRKPLEADSA